MVRLCEKFAIGYPNTEKIGVKYSDIRKELVSMKGGRNLGKMLDSLMFERKLPDISKSLKYYGLELVGKTSDDHAPEENLRHHPHGCGCRHVHAQRQQAFLGAVQAQTALNATSPPGNARAAN